MAGTVACPKCGRPLAPSGELSAGDASAAVYQCEECTMTGDLLGESIEVALTFVLDAAGRPIDSATGDRLHFPPVS